MKINSKFLRYEPSIKRLTKANSNIINNRVIYIVKQNCLGNNIKMFMAYDYKTKIQLYGHFDKDSLIEFLAKQDLKVLDELDLQRQNDIVT